LPLAGVLVSVAFRALLAVCVAFRALSVCWWYNYTSRARCAQYTPVSVPCVSCLYKHQPRQLLAAALLSALPCRVSVLALRLRGLLAAPVRINIRRRDFIPARLALPVSVYKRPVLPIFRRFGGLSAFRWCPVLARCPCARFAGVGVLIR